MNTSSFTSILLPGILAMAPMVAPAEIPADAYQTFIQKLDEQVKNNTPDFCPAVETVLKESNDDVFAVEEWMKKASDEGNAAARYYTALRTISFMPEDIVNGPEVKEAVALLKKSADQGFIPAQLQFVLHQRAGIGTPKDEKAADALLMKACKNGNILARFKWLALSGRLKQSSDIERKEVKSEMERGNHYVTYFASSLATDSKTQFEMLQKAAVDGSPDAHYDLSLVLQNTDIKKSYELLQAGAKLHGPASIFALGSFLMEPQMGKIAELNLTKDYENGLHLVRVASALDLGQADLALASAYYDGLYGLEKNRDMAYKYYAKAHRITGSIPAVAAQGLMLLKGEGTAADPERGMKYLKIAHDTGYGYASVLMAYAYYEGLGCEKDARKAIEYLMDASMNLPVAYVFMAYIEAKGGNNVTPNAANAESYVRMAGFDMGEKAKEMYDALMAEGKWEPRP